MLKFLLVPMLAVTLGQCQKGMVIRDFCKKIEAIGVERLLNEYTDEELRALKFSRKKALLALGELYDTNCTNTSN